MITCIQLVIADCRRRLNVECSVHIIRYMLNAAPRFHVGVNEFKYVGLLPVEYRVEQLKFVSRTISLIVKHHTI